MAVGRERTLHLQRRVYWWPSEPLKQHGVQVSLEVELGYAAKAAWRFLKTIIVP